MIACGLFQHRGICVGLFSLCHRLFKYLLPLDIQVPRRERGVPLAGLTSSHFVPVPGQNEPGFLTACGGLSLCSVS